MAQHQQYHEATQGASYRDYLLPNIAKATIYRPVNESKMQQAPRKTVVQIPTKHKSKSQFNMAQQKADGSNQVPSFSTTRWVGAHNEPKYTELNIDRKVPLASPFAANQGATIVVTNT